ncbi:ADP-ribosylhydrolase ARH3-like [Physella acuta]|uniref:ADP-ribosylhydrolase ARH3-like n=1 Tax=Physella acuta TaxID=109671 RepID=UPI0027DB9EF1|nr:ADP-ribosylhydrolase ARH3-like [Physella acuta]XP_059159989.1 ADP-ribosylhydrolase ARH3-like [Physella acuta]XP_059159991.1 ADP-ribosylhydrolase ARH3-like [Physella acuta]
MEADMMLSRFKGCLVGALTGDCIGAKFEGQSYVKLRHVLEHVEKINDNRLEQKKNGTRPADVYCHTYTDDTAMLRSVAYSLLDKHSFDARDMATRFAKEFDKEPQRGYGGNIPVVFKALLDPNLTDVFLPASQQFDGRGSYGNGGAMRIAPAPLFTFVNNDISKLMHLVTDITRITHSHHLAINGAILQALAVDQSLRLPVSSHVDADSFLDSLISKMRPVEEKNLNSSPSQQTKSGKPSRALDQNPTPYCAKLERMKEFLKDHSLSKSTVVDELGTDVSALGSVPAAIFAFLKSATQNIPKLEKVNSFEKSILYAISLGGDTDTVATMAGAIAGAFYGLESIPEPWRYYCEGEADAECMAERFFEAFTSPASSNDQ